MLQPNFSKSADGLLPAIVQDAETNKVLMLGYVNAESLEITIDKQLVTFYSRSKQRLWTKGEESGNFLEVQDILLDCDQDTLLIKAKPRGVVCHTGTDTCFAEKNESDNFIQKLEQTISQRQKDGNPDSSYVASLFAKGINKIAQKVGEEAIELVIEAKDNDMDLFKNEAADLLFHYLILLKAKGTSFEEVLEILKQRIK